MKWDIAIETRTRTDGDLDVLSILANGAGARVSHTSTAKTAREALVNELDYLHQLMSSEVMFGEGLGTPLIIDPVYLTDNMSNGGKNA